MSQQINLFNPAFEKRKQVLAAATMAQGLLLIALAGAGLYWYGARQIRLLEGAAAQSKDLLAAREARRTMVLIEYPARVKDPSVGQALAQGEADRAALLEAQKILAGGSLGNTQGYSPYFRAFARARVDGLWLTGASITGAGGHIGLQGRALQPSLVPAYINALGKDTVLRGKSFARLDIAAGVPKALDTGATQPAPVSAPAPAAPSAPLSALPALAGLPPELLRTLDQSGSQSMTTPTASVASAARPRPLPYVEFDLQSMATPAEAGAPTP